MEDVRRAGTLGSSRAEFCFSSSKKIQNFEKIVPKTQKSYPQTQTSAPKKPKIAPKKQKPKIAQKPKNQKIALKNQKSPSKKQKFAQKPSQIALLIFLPTISKKLQKVAIRRRVHELPNFGEIHRS